MATTSEKQNKSSRTSLSSKFTNFAGGLTGGLSQRVSQFLSHVEAYKPLVALAVEGQKEDLTKKVRGKSALAYSLARSTHFAIQQLSLPLLERLFTGRGRQFDQERLKQMGAAYSDLFELLKKDAANIEAGIYPLSVLEPESAVDHFPRIGRILTDAFKISQRREDKSVHDFTSEEKQYFSEVPEYATRNYHFQTGGYFHAQSAQIYDHQVEILFSGAADAMRRLILPQMKKYFPGDGEGLKFLEVAAGTGRLSKMIKLAYPKATLTVTDMSHPYLNQARKNLIQFDRTEFVRANAENIPFSDKSFDMVFSCFLFHEVPLVARDQILLEGRRLVKDGGLYGIVDSIQHVDSEKFSWALDSFPVDFHEPFYKAYVQNPLEVSLEKTGFELLESDRGFFSKSLLARTSCK